VRGRILPILVFVVSSLFLVHPTVSETNPYIANMLSGISESEIYASVYHLQNFTTRVYGTVGNLDAGTYLYNKFDDIPGLEAEFQSSYRNVIATLDGIDPTSNATYIVGAHYDSSSSDPNNAPGATDNGGGVAIVLELARIMSRYQFRHTLKFACWNYEEAGLLGSKDYAQYALTSGLNVSLYSNYDSSCYDPDNRFVLDIVYNSQSSWVKDVMTECNTLYGIGFSLAYNIHTACSSDHVSFWNKGHTVVMTHEETHGPAHSQEDTIDKVSTLYAKRNGQLGMSVLAELAEVESLMGDINADGVVDAQDLLLLHEAFGATSGSANWNAAADLTNDGIISLPDLKMLAKNYG